jgi:hypothetical protein
MDLKQLQSMGVLTSNPLVKRTITIEYFPEKPQAKWADASIPEREEESVSGTVDFWLRKLTAADQIAIASCIKEKRDPLYTMLHRSVYSEDGSRVFPTEEDAIGVDLTVFAGLVEEIHKLNGDFGKKSQPRTKRGAKSRSPSGAAASPNGKNTSAEKSSTSGSSTDASAAP